MSRDEIVDTLELMEECILLVGERFARIGEPNDFVVSAAGVTLLDAISMRLQVIGESVKRLQKWAPSFLMDFPEVEWEKIGKFRDLLSHHYEHVDHEIVFDICKEHLPKLHRVVQKMRTALSKQDERLLRKT
jgi:uncharacterized protein with HEPN domain